MSDKDSKSEQNKSYLKTLDIQNSTFLSKLELEDSQIKMFLARATNLYHHVQMMGLILLVGGVPTTTSFLVLESISPILSLVSLILLSSTGLPLLLLPLMLANHKQLKLEQIISISKNNLLTMKSSIYEYYAKYPETDRETYQRLHLFQNALHHANFFFLLYHLEKIYDQKRFVFNRKIRTNSKNIILQERLCIKNELAEYGKYYSVHYKSGLFGKLDKFNTVIREVMDEFGIDYKNQSSKTAI